MSSSSTVAMTTTKITATDTDISFSDGTHPYITIDIKSLIKADLNLATLTRGDDITIGNGSPSTITLTHNVTSNTLVAIVQTPPLGNIVVRIPFTEQNMMELKIIIYDTPAYNSTNVHYEDDCLVITNGSNRVQIPDMGRVIRADPAMQSFLTGEPLITGDNTLSVSMAGDMIIVWSSGGNSHTYYPINKRIALDIVKIAHKVASMNDEARDVTFVASAGASPNYSTDDLRRIRDRTALVRAAHLMRAAAPAGPFGAFGAPPGPSSASLGGFGFGGHVVAPAAQPTTPAAPLGGFGAPPGPSSASLGGFGFGAFGATPGPRAPSGTFAFSGPMIATVAQLTAPPPVDDDFAFTFGGGAPVRPLSPDSNAAAGGCLPDPKRAKPSV